jgi:uncharacterized protein
LEQPLKEHLEYTKKLWTDNKLLLAGPFLDDQGGFAVLRVSGGLEARKILSKESGVAEGVLAAELHPWYLLFESSARGGLFSTAPQAMEVK